MRSLSKLRAAIWPRAAGRRQSSQNAKFEVTFLVLYCTLSAELESATFFLPVAHVHAL